MYLNIISFLANCALFIVRHTMQYINQNNNLNKLIDRQFKKIFS